MYLRKFICFEADQHSLLTHFRAVSSCSYRKKCPLLGRTWTGMPVWAAYSYFPKYREIIMLHYEWTASSYMSKPSDFAEPISKTWKPGKWKNLFQVFLENSWKNHGILHGFLKSHSLQLHSLLTELLVDIYSVLVEMQLWQSNAWNYCM